MKKVAIKELHELDDRVPAHALVANVDLVVLRVDEKGHGVVWPVCASWRPYG